MLWSEPTGTANGRRRNFRSATSRCSTKSNRRAWKEKRRSGGEEMAIKSAIIAVVTAGLMAGGTRASERRPTPDKQEEGKGTKSQTTATTVQSVGGDAAYKIGPQDVLKIDVWKEEQLTRTVPVRPDGKITLPLLNDVQAVGLTPMELAGVISDQLKKYITNPQVTVSVTEINSRRVYVNGEVLKAGAYSL